MRGSRYCKKLERGAEVLLAPINMLCLNVDAPYFTLLDRITKPNDHSSRAAAEIQNPIGRRKKKIGLTKYMFHYINVLLPRI
jgi:hypothetical protein